MTIPVHCVYRILSIIEVDYGHEALCEGRKLDKLNHGLLKLQATRHARPRILRKEIVS